MHNVFLPYVANQQQASTFRWLGDVHAITFPVAADRETAAPAARRMNWYDWGRSNWADEPDSGYLNMVWKQVSDSPAAFRDEKRPLLLFNEPEYYQQANMSPEQVADGLHLYQDYPGELYGCGYGYHYFAQFQVALDTYRQRYGGEPRLDGLHLHVYFTPWSNLDAERPLFRRWREWADGRRVLVTEWGVLPSASVDPAVLRDRIPALWRVIEEELQPFRAFWFSWRMQDTSEDTGDIRWQQTNAADGVIGQGWRQLAGV